MHGLLLLAQETYSQVEYFVERSVPLFYLYTCKILLLLMVRFSTLLPFKSPKEQELFMEEFLDFQLLDDKDKECGGVWDKATVVEEEGWQRYHRLDILWHHLSSMRGPDNALCFPWLSKISRLVLTVLHSNAQEEHIFSMVRKKQNSILIKLRSQRNPV